MYDDQPFETVTTGRESPHSSDSERALLHVAMMHEAVMLDIDLVPEDFYYRAHQIIWQCCREQFSKHLPVSMDAILITLKQQGKAKEVGGLEYFESLLTAPAYKSSLKTYITVIKQRALERRMIAMAQKVSDIGYNAAKGDREYMLQEAYRVINEFMHVTSSNELDTRQINTGMIESIKAAEHRAANQGQIHGMPTGLKDLDKRIGGILDGDLFVIGARPSMGKSTLAMNIAESIAMQDQLVIVFSLEMQESKLMDRLLCAHARVDAAKYRRGDLSNDEWDCISKAASTLQHKPLYINADSSMTSGRMLATCRRIAHQHGSKPRLVVVDYLGLLKDPGEGENRISKISGMLKHTAMTLGCPVIALAQLNRGLENRPNKRPTMSDLRESGAIEQDADGIIMVYRDEVYNTNSPDRGIAELICVKLRDGEPGTVRVASHLYRNRFEDLAQMKALPGVMPAPSHNWLEKERDEEELGF